MIVSREVFRAVEWWAVLSLSGLVPPLLAQERPTAQVTAIRAVTTVKIDGRLNDPIWAEVPAAGMPYETFPGNNSPARVRTDCRIAYDDANLYVGCEAHDAEPHRIHAVRSDRDLVADQDMVGITLDPFLDRRRAWEFAVTPLGVQYDAIYTAGVEASDPSWNTIWNAAATIHEGGFVVEMAIPFKSLRFPGGGTEPSRWGLILWRKRPRGTDELIRSVPVDQGNGCLLCQAGTLVGIPARSSGRNLELSPTLVASRRDSASPPGNPLQRGDFRNDLGVDLRWSVTPSLTLNATLNPDFSQVEADAAQLGANTTFALYFPERRPFFLDGADLFETPERIAFTRTVVDPRAGAKFTMKSGRSAVGLMFASDRQTQLLVPGISGSTQHTLAGGSRVVMGRYRWDLLRSSTVGLMTTTRVGEHGDYANHVVGLDAAVRPIPSLGISAQVAGSATTYPDAFSALSGQPRGSFEGAMAVAAATLQTRSWQVGARAADYAKRFRADAGFMSQVGVTDVDIEADRVFWGGPGALFARLSVGAGQYAVIADTTPGYTNSWRFLRLSYVAPRLFEYHVYARFRSETYAGVGYDFFTPWMQVVFRPSGQARFNVSGVFGNAIDYGAKRLAHTTNVSGAATIRLSRSAELQARHMALRLWGAGDTWLTARVSELGVTYYPTSRLSLRALAQHDESRRTATLSPATLANRTRTLRSQTLVSYRIDAQTVAQIGYGDFRQAAFDQPAWDGSMRPTAASVFARFSIAFRP